VVLPPVVVPPGGVALGVVPAGALPKMELPPVDGPELPPVGLSLPLPKEELAPLPEPPPEVPELSCAVATANKHQLANSHGMQWRDEIVTK
jgi:hypothetical protein